MSKTTVVNIHRDEPYDVYVGRAGKGQDGYFGSPCVSGSRSTNIRAFESYFRARIARDPEYKARVLALRGQRLGCFCAPQICHAHVIAAWIDAQPEE